MRRLVYSLFFLIIVGCISVYAWSPPPQGDNHHHHRHNRGVVGTPLDGGLLAVLTAAGVGYYLIRKKRRNKE